MLVPLSSGDKLVVEFKHELHHPPTPPAYTNLDTPEKVLAEASKLKKEEREREKRHRRTTCKISYAKQVDGTKKDGTPAKVWKAEDSPIMETHYTAPQFEMQERNAFQRTGPNKGEPVRDAEGRPVKCHRKFHIGYSKEIGRRESFEQAMTKLTGDSSAPGMLYSRKQDRTALWDAFFKGRKAKAQANLEDAVKKFTERGIDPAELREFCKKHGQDLVRGQVDYYGYPSESSASQSDDNATEAQIQRLKKDLVGTLLGAIASRGAGGSGGPAMIALGSN